MSPSQGSSSGTHSVGPRAGGFPEWGTGVPGMKSVGHVWTPTLAPDPQTVTF